VATRSNAVGSIGPPIHSRRSAWSSRLGSAKGEQQLFVASSAATVLWRTGVGTVEAHGVFQVVAERVALLDDHRVVPPVAEVVLIGNLVARGERPNDGDGLLVEQVEVLVEEVVAQLHAVTVVVDRERVEV